MRLFSVMGVPIRISLWLLPVAVVSVMAGQAEQLAVVMLAVVVHELGHAVVARMLGLQVSEIEVFMLGGVFRLSSSLSYTGWREAVVALAGPFTSLFFAMATQIVERAWVLPEALFSMARIHLTLALFNLLPALPMDGGRVLRAVLAAHVGYYKATRIAVWISRGIAAAFLAWTIVGLCQGVLLMAPATIGCFLMIGIQRECRSAASCWGAIAHKRDVLKRGNALPVHYIAVSEDTRLGDVLKGMSRSRCNRVLVMDARMCTRAVLDETALSGYAARYGLDAPIGREIDRLYKR